MSKVIEVDVPKAVHNNYTIRYANVFSNLDVIVKCVHTNNLEGIKLEGFHIVRVCPMNFVDTLRNKNIVIEHPDGDKIEVNTSTFKEIPYHKMRYNIGGRGVTAQHNFILEFHIKMVSIEEFNKMYDLIKKE